MKHNLKMNWQPTSICRLLIVDDPLSTFQSLMTVCVLKRRQPGHLLHSLNKPQFNKLSSSDIEYQIGCYV